MSIRTIDPVVSQLYASIGFEMHRRPAYDDIRSILLPECRLVNDNGDKPLVLTVEDFITVVEEQIRLGTFSEFQEQEIWSRTDSFGKIAQRFSTYEARYRMKGVDRRSFGINSIQLIEIAGSWYVASLVWNDEREGLAVPESCRGA